MPSGSGRVVNVKMLEQLATTRSKRCACRRASSIRQTRAREVAREQGRGTRDLLPVVHLYTKQYAFEPVAPGWRGRGERPTTLKRATPMRLALSALLLAPSSMYKGVFAPISLTRLTSILTDYSCTCKPEIILCRESIKKYGKINFKID